MALHDITQLASDAILGNPVDPGTQPDNQGVVDTFHAVHLDLAEINSKVSTATSLGRNVIDDGASPSASASVNGAAFDDAADAVITDGTRTLYVNGGAYDASLATLDKIHSTILVGTGSVTNLYRKRVFHPLTPGPAANYSGDIVPSLQMRRLNSAYERTGTITVVLWSDSIGTYQPSTGTGPNSATTARMDLKVMAYINWLKSEFPGVTLNFYDRGIGSQRPQDWDKVDAGDPAVYTWYVAGQAWNYHIGLLNPDLVIVAMGMNRSSSIGEFGDIRGYLTTLGCDVLWETNLHPNLASGSYTQTTLELLDQEAGMVRSYSKNLGTDGLVDFHRQCLIARDGFDIRMAHSLDTTYEVITPTAGQCIGTKYAYNWKIKTIFDASAWADGASDQLQVIIGAQTDYLSIKKSAGGFWTFQWVCTGTTALAGTLFTSTLATSTSATAQFTVEIRDDIVTVYAKEGSSAVISEDPVYTSRVVRKTTYIKPFVQTATGSGITLVSAAFTYAEQRLNMPLTTNKELWDSDVYTDSGGINHPTSIASDLIYAPVLQQLRLRYPAGGPLHADFSQLGTPASTVETTLTSKSIAALAVKLNTSGSINFVALPGANGNTKTMRVKLAGTTIYTYAAAQNGGSISGQLYFGVDTTNTKYWGNIITAAGTVQVRGTFLTSAWASAVSFSITGQNDGAAAANDLIVDACTFDIVPRIA